MNDLQPVRTDLQEQLKTLQDTRMPGVTSPATAEPFY